MINSIAIFDLKAWVNSEQLWMKILRLQSGSINLRIDSLLLFMGQIFSGLLSV